MDHLDVAIFRELCREKVVWWGAFDPRLSDEAVARRVGVARSTVRARLARWRTDGFLRSHAIIPNPRLFGVRIAGSSLRVDDVRAKPRVIEALSDVDGAFALLDHVGPWIALGLIDDTPAGLARRRRLIQHLPGVDEVLPCFTMNTPVCGQVLSPLDWRIVAALRARPDGTIRALASDVGVSQKTLGRRYAALIRSRAVWYLPQVDFGRAHGTIARVIAFLKADSDGAATLRGLRKLERVLSIEDTRGVSAHHTLEAYVHLASAADIEDVERAALSIDGVEAVESVYPRRGVIFSTWADDRVAERVSQRSST